MHKRASVCALAWRMNERWPGRVSISAAGFAYIRTAAQTRFNQQHTMNKLILLIPALLGSMFFTGCVEDGRYHGGSGYSGGYDGYGAANALILMIQITFVALVQLIVLCRREARI